MSLSGISDATVIAPDGSAIHPPQTATTFNDRKIGSTRAPDVAHPAASPAHFAPHARPAAPAPGTESGDVIVRADGSVDAAQTGDHYRTAISGAWHALQNSSFVRHAGQYLSDDPAEAQRGAEGLAVDASAGLHSAGSAIASGAGAAADAAKDSWTIETANPFDPKQQRNVDGALDRQAARARGLYDATLGPVVNDSLAFGHTVAHAGDHPATALADIGAAGAVAGGQIASLAVPEAKGAEVVTEGAETALRAGAAATRAARAAYVPDRALVDAYAAHVNSNKPWAWHQIEGGATLTASQRAAVKKAAVDQGKIHDIPVDPVTRAADFSKVRIATKQLPKDLWTASDQKQFAYLDATLPGKKRPAGYTWHHAQAEGQMELVPLGIHNVTNHAGGRAPGFWAAGPR